jgi:hypothetical protein
MRTDTSDTMQDIVEVIGYAPDSRGNARDGNGKSYTQHAIEFIRDYPIGSFLVREALDEWLCTAGLLDIPSEDTPKDANEWMGHLLRRRKVCVKLNEASIHPRMFEYGVEPYVIAAVHGGYEVSTPASEVINGKIAKKFRTITETKRRQLLVLMRAADWSKVPLPTKTLALGVYLDIEAFAQDTKTGAERIGHKLSNLHKTVQKVLGRPVDLDARWAEMDAAGGYTDEANNH